MKKYSKYIATAAICAVIAIVVMFGDKIGPSPAPDGPVISDIVGSQYGVTGDVVVFVAAQEAAYYSWTAPADAQVERLYGGRVLVVLFTKPGHYVVALASGSGRSVSSAIHYITISGEAPLPPNPGPEPGPDPGPSPGPESEWAKWTRDTVITSVPANGRVEQCAQLAGALRTLAAKIAAGGVADCKLCREELRQATNAALGRDSASWVKFSLQFATHLKSLADSGKLKTAAQYQYVYTEVAKGLDSVAEGK